MPQSYTLEGADSEFPAMQGGIPFLRSAVPSRYICENLFGHDTVKKKQI